MPWPRLHTNVDLRFLKDRLTRETLDCLFSHPSQGRTFQTSLRNNIRPQRRNFWTFLPYLLRAVRVLPWVATGGVWADQNNAQKFFWGRARFFGPLRVFALCLLGLGCDLESHEPQHSCRSSLKNPTFIVPSPKLSGQVETWRRPATVALATVALDRGERS